MNLSALREAQLKDMGVVVATATMYRDATDIRLALALKTAQALADAGIMTVVVDGSTVEGFRESLSALGVILEEDAGATMGASRRQALSVAAKVASGFDDAIVWMEPEKYSFVPFIRHLGKRLGDQCDMIIPRRASLSSYPSYQASCELRGNWEAGTVTGRPDLDLWFGPRVMNLEAVEFFTAYRGEYGDRWDSIFIPPLRIMAAGLNVESATVPYVHPLDQMTAEAGNSAMDAKRDIQLESLLDAIRKEGERLGL